jgi:hypothetical protein
VQIEGNDSHRNHLWQCDISSAPFMLKGKDGAMQHGYLVCFVDDTTRLPLHGGFYPTPDQGVVDCFRDAVQKLG